MTGEEQKQMWLGTHYRPESGDAFLSMSVDNGTIRFLNSGDTESIKFHIDHTMFTDSTTPSGEWHILEFPFDEAYETIGISSSIAIRKLHLELSVSWTRKGDITNVNSRANTHNGEPFIELSDLRVGESGLVGVDTVGKQKFLMSYTYDDKENESLLYNFGATPSNTSNQEVVLPNSTSSYKIGIENILFSKIVLECLHRDRDIIHPHPIHHQSFRQPPSEGPAINDSITCHLRSSFLLRNLTKLNLLRSQRRHAKGQVVPLA